jgi:hypothetical protein
MEAPDIERRLAPMHRGRIAIPPATAYWGVREHSRRAALRDRDPESNGSRERPERHLAMRFRIGINVNDAMVKDGDIFLTASTRLPNLKVSPKGVE